MACARGLRALRRPLWAASRGTPVLAQGAGLSELAPPTHHPTPRPLLGAGGVVGQVLHWPGQGSSSSDLRRSLSSSSSSSSTAQAELSKADALKRLLFRSKQRGVLELDLLVGQWAEANVGSLSDIQLCQLAELLDQESPDLLQWLLGQAAPPEHVAANQVFEAIRSQVSQRLSDHAHPSTKASPGAAWVRGWEDIGKSSARAVGLPPGGNQ